MCGAFSTWFPSEIPGSGNDTVWRVVSSVCTGRSSCCIGRLFPLGLFIPWYVWCGRFMLLLSSWGRWWASSVWGLALLRLLAFGGLSLMDGVSAWSSERPGVSGFVRAICARGIVKGGGGGRYYFRRYKWDRLTRFGVPIIDNVIRHISCCTKSG